MTPPDLKTANADTLLTVLVGDRDTDDDMQWWQHLTTRAAVLTEVTQWVGDERALIIEGWHCGGDSFAVIGNRVGLTRSRVQQLVTRGRIVSQHKGRLRHSSNSPWRLAPDRGAQASNPQPLPGPQRRPP